MKVGIVDVGSNTVRLLVAAPAGRRARPAGARSGEHLFLGEDVEREGGWRARGSPGGALCAARYARIARAARRRARRGHRHRARATERERRASLVRELAAATGVPVRVLSADEEGRLAFAGRRRGRQWTLPESVAVCDVGGGSTEVVVGTVEGGPAWSRSLDIGAVRLTQRFLGDDPPGRRCAGRRARRGRAAPGGLRAAAAAGGARRRRHGPRAPQARRAGARGRGARRGAPHPLQAPVRRRSRRTFGIHERRARTLAAGAVILSCLQARLGVPLEGLPRGPARGRRARARSPSRAAAAALTPFVHQASWDATQADGTSGHDEPMEKHRDETREARGAR